jgi:outer membrane protein assembly factor BamB
MELLRRHPPALRLAALGLAVLLLGASCRKRLSLPDGPADRREWMTAGGGEDSPGWSPERLLLPLELRWKARTRGSVVASPLVIGDLICVGSLGKRFYFLSAADGGRYSALKTDAGISATAAAGEGSVYLATGVGEGLVYGLDLEAGRIRWKTAVGDVSAALSYHRERLLVSTNEGEVVCLAAGDGSVLWRFSTRGRRTTAAAVAGETAVCGCDDGYLYALGVEDGGERWSRQLEGAVWARPSAAAGRVCAGTFEGFLYCLAADDGETIWCRELEGSITRPPVQGGGSVFAGTDRGLLTAVDRRSGETIWENRLDDARPGSPLATPDALFVGDSQGRLLALSSGSGELLWSHRTDRAIVAAPVIREGRLFVGSMDDHLYAFAPAASGSTAVDTAAGGVEGPPIP